MSIWSALLMCVHGLGAAVSRLFGRQNGGSSQNYRTISQDTEHLVQSDSTTVINQSKQSKGNAKRQQSLINRRQETQGNAAKTGKPPRPNPPNVRGPGDGSPKQLGDVSRPPRPDPPSSVGGRGATDSPAKQHGDVPRPPRPDPPSNVGSRGPTDSSAKQHENVSRPPRPDLPFKVGGRSPTGAASKQLGDILRPLRHDPSSNVGGRGPTDSSTNRNEDVSRPPKPDAQGAADAVLKRPGDILRPPRPDLPFKVGGQRPTDFLPKQHGDNSRPPRPDLPFKVGGRGPTDSPPKRQGDSSPPPRPAPPSKAVQETSNVQKLSDAHRKQLGDSFRPLRPDPPFGVGNRRVNEDFPKTTGGNEVQVTKNSDNSPKVKQQQAATIKLPKRRSSLQKPPLPQKPEGVSQSSQKPQVKSPAIAVDPENNRVAALRQRLLEMQSPPNRGSRKISIPISKSEGNVAKKTRSLEDKLFCGGFLAPTLFPLFNKPKKNTVTGQGNANLDRSFSVGSCVYDHVKFEEFFKP